MPLRGRRLLAWVLLGLVFGAVLTMYFGGLRSGHAHGYFLWLFLPALIFDLLWLPTLLWRRLRFEHLAPLAAPSLPASSPRAPPF